MLVRASAHFGGNQSCYPWDEADTRLVGPEEIVTILHVVWGHASAYQLRRVLVDPDGETVGLANPADEEVGRRGVGRRQIRRPTFRLRAPRWRRLSMGNCKLVRRCRLTRLPCARWICAPCTPFWPQLVREAIGEVGCCLQLLLGNLSPAEMRSGRCGW